VTWPTREHVRNLTLAVFVISFIFGVYIAFWDIVWSQALVLITDLFS